MCEWVPGKGGGNEGVGDSLTKCSSCPRRFHKECLRPEQLPTGGTKHWQCPSCSGQAPGTAADTNGPLYAHEKRRRRGLGPSAANGVAGSRGCGAEDTLLQTCDLSGFTPKF